MPRYFYHVQDGSNFVDEGGTELSGIEEARTKPSLRLVRR